MLNTLDPRITFDDDEGCAATPVVTLVGVVVVNTVVPDIDAAVRPATFTIVP